MCPNNITLCFHSIFASILCLLWVFFTATTPRATTPHLYCKGMTPSPLHGYHACVFISRLPRQSSEFHFWVITPELSRSTTHVNREITPALVSSSWFTDHRLLRHFFPPPTPPPGRHTYQPTPHASVNDLHRTSGLCIAERQ